MDEIEYTNSLHGLVNAYKDFFDYYFDGSVLAFPKKTDDFPFKMKEPHRRDCMQVRTKIRQCSCLLFT